MVPSHGFEQIIFTYRGSTDVGLNDWGTQDEVDDWVNTDDQLDYLQPPLPSNAVFYLVSATNPVPEPETWALILFGLGMLAFVAQHKGHAVPAR